MKNNFTCSVAMAACNGEKYIEEQLKSILSQTKIPDEIIICDDSRDSKTKEAITSLIANHNNIIKYFHNEEQLGVSKNFEKAISLTTGDIIFLSDQDDIWEKDKVEHFISLFKASPSSGGVFSNSELVDDKLISLNTTHWDLRNFNLNNISKHTDGLQGIFCKQVSCSGHNIAFKKELKELILPFPHLKECHDTWIGLIIAMASKWSITDACLTKYRQHNDNVSKMGRKSQLKEAIDSIKNNTFDWNCELYSELVVRLERNGFTSDDKALKLLKDRRDHSKNRAAMNNCNILTRTPLIAKEIAKKRYFKYGRGFKSIIQDSILRGK